MVLKEELSVILSIEVRALLRPARRPRPMIAMYGVGIDQYQREPSRLEIEQFHQDDNKGFMCL